MATSGVFKCGDCLELLKGMADNSVDLVCGSSPYEDARLYAELNFKVRGQDWVEWALPRYLEMVRVSRGVVLWNCEGKTRDFQWSAVPALLMAELHKAGVQLRKPPIFKRIGVPGSGGPDWLRNDYEFCICSSKGKLAWSDNTAMGHPPKWAPGGEMSHMLANGERRNQWGGNHASGGTTKSGQKKNKGNRPSHVFLEKVGDGAKVHTKAEADGTMREQAYMPPAIANPGNVIEAKYTIAEVERILANYGIVDGVASEVTEHIVGGGVMGHPFAHENEAPFPESLPEFFIRSFCPPGGTVLDPFSGSGTTVCVAVRCGRNGIGFDVRQSQVDLGYRRLAEVQTELF